MGNLIGVGLTVSYRLSSESFGVFLPLHRRVLDAILAGDSKAAHGAMARLLADTRAFLNTQLGRPRGKTGAAPRKRKARSRAPA
jgi:DNA-binding GntR family transcriptional regulator